MSFASAIINRIKEFVTDKSIVNRFITVNIAIFLGIHLLSLTARLLGATFSPSAWLELPPVAFSLIHRPWSVITYMFTHYRILHLLFNMLWLYWFGIVFSDYFSRRTFAVTYLIGGLSGALFYYLGCAVFAIPSGGLLGSSAAVFAIVTAIALRAPDYHMNLWLIGLVKIKWIAIICIAFMLLTAGNGNTGGLLAHLGGITAGAAISLADKHKLFRKKKKCIILNLPDSKDQAAVERELDALLIKVKRSGYSSLSKADRMRLIELSKQLK